MTIPNAARVYELQALISNAVTADDADDDGSQFTATARLAELLLSYEQRIADLEAQLANR